MKALLEIGYVSRAHGLHGEVVVKTFDPQSTALSEAKRVVLRTRAGEDKALELASLGEAPGGDLLVRFKRVTRREAAEALVGSTVQVRREDLPPPAEGEFFHGDLVGLEAVTAGGQRLGVVEAVWSTGPVPNLCIRDGETELLVPFATDFVTKVELAAGRIVIMPPEYEEA